MEEKKISISIDGNAQHSFQQVMLKQVINDHHYFEISFDIEVGEAYATHPLEKAKNWLGKKVSIEMALPALPPMYLCTVPPAIMAVCS